LSTHALLEDRVMEVRVSYITTPNQVKSGNQIDAPIYRDYASIDEAQAAPFPEHTEVAIIHVEGGYYSCELGAAWKYHEGDVFDDRTADR
jgi:hypothetical protein